MTQAAPPYVECVQWVPRRFSGGAAPATIVDLVFTQQVLAEIHAQLASAPASPVLGAIVGTIFEDPTCARRWARLDRVVGCPVPVDEDAEQSELHDAITRTRQNVGEGTVLGWYRTHHQAGLYLSPVEAAFHEREFNDPSGFALILAGATDRLAGGVFQRTDPDGLSRSVYTPFYELAAEDPRPGSSARRTLLTWANYQTEARVVRPGETEGPVTVATIPELGDTVAPAVAPPDRERANSTGPEQSDVESIVDEVEATRPPPEHVSPAVEGLPLLEPVGEEASSVVEEASPAAAESESTSTDEVDPEWEKIQIQRSLMAVGRSLGPTTIGELGAPAPAEPTADQAEDTAQEPTSGPREVEDADHLPQPQADPTPLSIEPERPALTVIDAEASDAEESDQATPSEAAVVIPISSGGQSHTPLVGRSRRRNRLPLAKIVGVAAGAVLLLGAGWFGTRAMAENDGEADGESAVAGLSLSPTELFGQNGDDEATERGESGSPEAQLDSSALAAGSNADGSTEAGGDTPAESRAGVDDIGALDPLNVVVDDAAQSGETAGQDGGTPPLPSPLPPQIVEAPSLDSFQVADPAMSAFDNVLTIFRAEIDRYEELRKEFDDGLTTCNPLNLAYRGVRDAHTRIDRRYVDVADRIDGATSRVYQAAVRQFAVARTHYELTDCPLPIGG